MYYSYVMGIDDSILGLKNQGFKIEKDGENYKVAFPKDKAPIWETFIARNLQMGYWNEYLEENKVVFLFQMEHGIKRYEVYDFKNKEVLALCEELSGQKMGSLMRMLSKNHYYKGVLANKLKARILQAVIICASVGILFSGIMYKKYVDKKELERKEETVAEMVEVAQKLVESLDEHDYEAYMDVFTDERKDYIEDIDAMYEFLGDERYGYEEEINYEEFSFELDEVFDELLERFYDDEYTIEDILQYGLDIRVEYGNSEKTFQDLWSFRYTIDDGKIKIHEGIYYSYSGLKRVYEKESE